MNRQNKNEITLKKMGIKDIDKVLDLEKRVFSIPWTRNMFVEEMNNTGAIYFVALADKRIVAYAGFHVILDEGHITNIAVDPVYRRQHIACRLMDEILNAGRAYGLSGLTLEVRAGNEPAISLYERYGFLKQGRRKAYYRDNREDAIIMWYYFDHDGREANKNGKDNSKGLGNGI